MPRSWCARILAGVLVLAAAGCAPSRSSSPGPSPVSPVSQRSAPLMPTLSSDHVPTRTAAALQAVLDKWVDGGHAPGATAAVLSADGIWSGAAGVDGMDTKLVPEAVMAIASITKTFVAAEVMLLSAQGLVDLDAPLADYVAMPFDDRGATVRQTLGMLSGFPDVPHVKLAATTGPDPHRRWTPQEVLDLIDVDAPRLGSVGTSQHYNNLNYILLGRLVEQVTGDPLAVALRRDLLEPAGLDRVAVQDAERPQPPLARAAREREERWIDLAGEYLPSLTQATVAGAAGGMAGDAPAIARWGYLLYGGHVIDTGLVEQMTNGEGEDDWYGLGTMRWERDGGRVVGHSGGLEGYHGLLAVWPEGATSVAVLVPQSRPLVIDVSIETVADQLYDAAHLG